MKKRINIKKFCEIFVPKDYFICSDIVQLNCPCSKEKITFILNKGVAHGYLTKKRIFEKNYYKRV